MSGSVNESKKHESMATRVALFEGKKIRKVFQENEWWFSVVRENRTTEIRITRW